MPWVIWDILVPMLATFLIGLATGWLLWRWRRQKVSAAPTQSQAVDDSANFVLIEERDAALARANAADTEIEKLKAEIELQVMGESDSYSVQALVAADEQATDTANVDVEALGRELEKEKASKAEVERSLVELNTRYKDLSIRLEKEVSSEVADTIKDASVLESNFKTAQETISEQGKKLKQLEENEQALKQKYEQEIAVKNAQLKQERTESEEVRIQLTREKLANEKAAVDAMASSDSTLVDANRSSADIAAVGNQSNKIHHLTAMSAGSDTEPSGSDAPDTTPRSNTDAVEASNIMSSGGRKDAEPDQSTSDSGLHDQSSPALANNSGQSSNEPSSSGQANAVRTGSTPTIENEDLVVDESAPGNTATETISIENDERTNNVAEVAEASPTQRAAGVSVEGRQNITSINATPRKPVDTGNPGGSIAASQSVATPKEKNTTLDGNISTASSAPETSSLDAEHDDLKEIKGVGPVLEKMLHVNGIHSFHQVALLDANDVQKLDDQIPQLTGRIQRDRWVQQARTLHSAKYGASVSRKNA